MCQWGTGADGDILHTGRQDATQLQSQLDSDPQNCRIFKYISKASSVSLARRCSPAREARGDLQSSIVVCLSCAFHCGCITLRDALGTLGLYSVQNFVPTAELMNSPCNGALFFP